MLYFIVDSFFPNTRGCQLNENSGKIYGTFFQDVSKNHGISNVNFFIQNKQL